MARIRPASDGSLGPRLRAAAPFQPKLEGRWRFSLDLAAATSRTALERAVDGKRIWRIDRRRRVSVGPASSRRPVHVASHNPGWVTGDEGPGRHREGDHASCRDHRPRADRDPLQHQGATTDPDPIFHNDGLHAFFMVSVETMEISIHDHDIPRNTAISPDRDLPTAMYLGAVSKRRSITNHEPGRMLVGANAEHHPRPHEDPASNNDGAVGPVAPNPSSRPKPRSAPVELVALSRPEPQSPGKLGKGSRIPLANGRDLAPQCHRATLHTRDRGSGGSLAATKRLESEDRAAPEACHRN